MVGWHFQCFGLIKLGDLAYKLCGSRKYPYPPPPPPRKTIGNSEGEGGFKGSNFQGVRGGSWETVFQRVMDAHTKH